MLELMHVRTHYNTKNEYVQRLSQAYRKQEGIEWIFIDEGSHCCSGDSKRIRLKTSMLPGLLYILRDRHV